MKGKTIPHVGGELLQVPSDRQVIVVTPSKLNPSRHEYFAEVIVPVVENV